MNTLELSSISKVYPGTVAVKDFSASFGGGQVHALIGKNGSGKSTLVKIISGAVEPTSGEVRINSEVLAGGSTLDSINQGVAVVYQEISLIPTLTVAENIYFGELPKKGVFIDWDRANRDAGKLLADMGAKDIVPDEEVARLSMAQMQMVEIAKAMRQNPKVLLLDEPTSSLALKEVRILFEFIKRLKTRGVVIVYITHKLQELADIADTVTVIRDGKYIATVPVAEATPERTVEMMFAESVPARRPSGKPVSDEIVMRTEKLTDGAHFFDIDFSLRRGEVLGIAGMLGSGRTELLRCLFGADRPTGGRIFIMGQEYKKPSPSRSGRFGLAMTSEDRKREGLVHALSIWDNLCLASKGRISSRGFITRRRERPYVEKQIRELMIKVSDADQAVTSLSGGNQQKVVVGNWLNNQPKIILFDEPSRGIDVQAKRQIFQIIWELSEKGVSSLLVSSELEELLENCHRILIMHKGRLISEVLPENLTVESLYAKCMG